MAANENSEDVSTACDREIADLLQADLNLRTTEWENSSSELISHKANEVQEEICESFIEEIVVQQKNESYIAGIDDECMEESIVYVFEEPVVELELTDSHYIIQEPETFEMEDSEVVETDIIDSPSEEINKNEENICEDNILSEENVECENNIVQETSSKEEFENKSVNNCSENELDVNKCTVSLPLPSDNSLKSCNFNENSDSLEYNLTESAVVEENDMSDALVEDEAPVQVFSLYNEDDPVTNIVIEPIPEIIPVAPISIPNPEPEIVIPFENISPQISIPTVQIPPSMLPSVLNKNKLTPIRKAMVSAGINSPTETKSPQSDSSLSPALKTLGKDQIKKRLQSFSLMKQGIKPIPIKKIVSPKQPKVQTQIEEVYDETGRKIDEKLVIKKPPKQGPTPSEKARQVIDEIEQIKREEAAIYEQTLLFMKHSMRDAHRKKSKYRRRDRSKSPIRRQKNKRVRRVSDDKNRKSLENDKHRKSPESVKCDKIKKDKSLEKESSKNVGMPKNWAEIKQKHIGFNDIKVIKEKIFKFSEDPRSSPIRTNKGGKKKKLRQQLLQKQLERSKAMKKEDFVKPQLIFEHPSVLRTSLIALSVTGASKFYPPEIIRFTEKLPSVSYCENPNNSTILFRTREQVLSEIPEERIPHMMKIIKNQTEPVKTPKYVATSWYPAQYLEESNEPEVPISYGLSVLTEMYNDEQEEIHEKPLKTSKVKKKSKKHKKHKSKSKSRSLSKEKSQKHDNKKVDDNGEYQEKNPNDESSVKNVFAEDKGEETPNTDEYRSNWESDEDLLNELMPNDRRSYNKSYEKSLTDSWGIEERHDKYDRRNFEENRRNRMNSSEHLPEERNRMRPEEEKRYDSRKSIDLQLEFEDRHSTTNRISEERIYSRHNFDKIDNKWSIESKKEMEEYENRHTVLKNPSRYNFESEEREKRRYSESDNRKSRESIEKTEFDRQRKTHESDRYKKSEELVENIEINRQRRSTELSEQEIDRRCRYSVEHDKKRISDFKEEKVKHNSNSKTSVDLEHKRAKDRHESEEKSYSSSKHKIEEKLHEQEFKSREKKISVSSDSDKKHDLKLERSVDIEHDKNADAKHKNMYHKWSSDEDIHKSIVKHDKKKSENQHKMNIEGVIELNINYKLQKSQWSSDEEDDRKKCVDNRRSINYENDLQFVDKNKSESDSYRNTIENLLNDDLMNLKDLQRNRLLAEEKHYQTKDEEEFEGTAKRKSRMEMLEDEKKERYKKDKKKNKDKKMKNKKRDKVPTVQITYSDFEESFDEDFQTAKQKEQILFVPNVENAKKHAAKIKIDYSDFDLSLSESKDKYDKKLEESIQTSPEVSKTVDACHTPKERKMNIDLSEIFVEHHSPAVKNIEAEVNTPKLQLTADKDIESTSQVSCIKNTPEASKVKTPIISSISKISTNVQTSKILPITPTLILVPDEHIQEFFTPVTNKISEEYIDQKSPFGKSGTKIEIAGISAIVPKNSSEAITSSVLLTPTVSTINILQEISPVAPPITPVTPDASKLVSEYEEFMKAVSFDEPKEENLHAENITVADTIETPKEDLTKNDVDSNKQVEVEKEENKCEESNSSSEESSSEYDTSSEEASDSSSDSESLSPDSAQKKMLETVANIKTEKVTDSENESQESRTDKRKRKEDSPENDSLQDVVIKIEKETKKMRKSEEIKTFDCESKYDNVIDWEKSCVEDTNIHLYNDYSTDTNKYSHLKLPIIDICDMIPPNVLPENIPLPTETVVDTTPIQSISSTDYSGVMLSPTDIITISSDNSTPSPTKKPRSFIPIKLLTAESRKQANETAQSSTEIFVMKDLTQDNTVSVESSNDIFELNQDILSTSQSETTEDQEQNGLRKRKSQWNLNISPAKKPLLQTTSVGGVDSDEDFTDKFIKQSDKKTDKSKKEEENKGKEIVENIIKESVSKPEPSIRDDKKDEKKTNESRKPKDDDDKYRRGNDKPREKSRHSPERHKDDHKDHRSISPKSEKEKRTSRRNSRERLDRHDKYDRNDRRDKTRSPDRKRDRSREVVRDRDNRRLSDRRLSDRKQPYPRGRSPRSRYSREREVQRARPRERSKDRTIRPKEFERDRSRERDKSRDADRSREIGRERDRSRDRDHRERDERKNYRRDDRRYSRSPSPHRKDYREMENIPPSHHKPDDTDFSTTSMDIVQSPVNSPLDGFKRSLADSTISDSELITQLNTPDESNEPSPAYTHLPPQQYYPTSAHEIPPQCHQSPASPKRISLDDRINLVLGIEKEPPKSIDTVCTRGPYANSNPQNYELYNYGRTEYDLYNSQNQQSEGYGPAYSTQYQSPYYPNTENNVKVVQVGNVIQVVPTEQPVAIQATPVPKPTEVPPKVVQVGNMLQIVPMTIIDTTVVSSPITSVAPIPVPEKPIVPKATDQLTLERRAEKEKRRQEREVRRKEKEKKRKEKEKRRQLKIKTKTENMIKRALLLETGEGELDISNIDAEPVSELNDNNNLPMSWPPASSLTIAPLPKAPGKGILVSHGFREKDDSFEEALESKKVVKFADGICPGEGTSPSGGEELPSPPPPPRKLPKEKRYNKKVKNKNKKKIKVKIIRTQQQSVEDESSEEDNLPPPPPPPGSPPIHLWPPRIKQPPVNNIHPSLPTSVFPHAAPTYPAPQQMMYPPAFPPIATGSQSVPVVVGHAPPSAAQRQHHPPVMPVLQTGVPPPQPHHGAHQSSFHH